MIRLPDLSFDNVREAAQPGGFVDALLIAAHAHVGQTDKGGEPYIMHPIRVAQAVWHKGEDYRIVAVLHDVIEDSAVQLASLCTAFNPAVIAALDAMTKRKGETYQEYLRRVAADRIAKAVKLADLADNMDPRRRYENERYQERMERYRLAFRWLAGLAA